MNLRHPAIAIPLAAVASLLAAAGIIRSLRPGPIPDRVEAVGRFEIVTRFTRDESRTDEDSVAERYSLRWRGEEFAFVGVTGLGARTQTYRTVNSVITFPASEPAFVVNVGYPDLTTFFYLVREVGGRPTAEPLGPDSGAVTADWIDPSPGDTTTERDRDVRRRHLAGGTLLLLGNWTVLDTRTLRSYQLRPHDGARPDRFALPNALSPDRRSFARLAAVGPEHAPLLLVHTFAAGASYVLPIDRRAMRYNDFKDIDRRWVDHHFQWRSEDGGPEHLVPREGVAPLPHHVRRSPGDEDDNPSFMILPVKREMKDTLIAFLQREMGAVSLDTVPVEPDAEGWTPPTAVRVGEEMVYVTFLSEQGAGTSSRVAVWSTLGRPSRITVRIADRFDTELRTGRHDALFDP